MHTWLAAARSESPCGCLVLPYAEKWGMWAIMYAEMCNWIANVHREESVIRTIQMTLDETLLERIDAAAAETGASRSAFIRDAVEMALKQLRIRRLEAQQIAGYKAQPVTEEAIAEWDSVRAWGDE